MRRAAAAVGKMLWLLTLAVAVALVFAMLITRGTLLEQMGGWW